MLTNIMLYVFTLLTMIGSGEDVDSIIKRGDYIKDGCKIRIIAEKHQLIENGLRFSVELENTLEEPISFSISDADVPFIFRIFNDAIVKKREPEEPPPFTLILKLADEADLAWNFGENDFYTSGHAVTGKRRITLNGNSKIQLGSVVFSKYAVIIEEGFVHGTDKDIIPGIYRIENVRLLGYALDDSNTDEFPKEENYERSFTLTTSEPVEVVME